MKEKLRQLMVVDDDLDIQNILSLYLSSMAGFQVTLCSSAYEAFKQLEKKQPQLILLDVVMPSMDGPTLLKKLREQKKFKEIPVVFMTAKDDDENIEEYTQLGAQGVISKPFNAEALPAKLMQIWEKIS